MGVSVSYRRIVLSGVLAGLFLSSILALPILVDADALSLSNVGPFVDSVVFDVIPNQDTRILSLLAGDVELDYSYFDPVHLPTLLADPDISIDCAVRNGYGHITINCAKYPLNISGFRRAFAFAFNKSRLVERLRSGCSVLHDSLVPLASGWCIEEDLPWHYYAAQPEIGNQILDDLGFAIDIGTGYRLAPNGSQFSVVVEYASGPLPEQSSASYAVEALQSLHVDAIYLATDFLDYIDRIDHHLDYDMVCYAVNFDNYGVEWLADEYWSQSADVPFENPCNFRNESFDAWRDQLLHGTDFEDVYKAASEMQRILHENVPRLVIYEDTYLCAYRNDVYTGHVLCPARGIAGPWTLRKMHRIDGTYGGLVNVALGWDPDCFNIFNSTSAYTHHVVENLWPTLFAQSPENLPWPYLAQSLLTETHAENPSVPQGHVRYTMEVLRNATWSDGTPLTAEDVAFTFSYILLSGDYGNPAAALLQDLVAAYAPSPRTVVLEYGTESYWNLDSFAYLPIIPKHIFNDSDGIGYSGWAQWNPVLDPDEPHVTSGPFILTDYQRRDYYVLSANPSFAFFPSATSSTSSTVSGNGPSTNGSTLSFTQALLGGFSGACIAVIVYCSVRIFENKRRNSFS
jgi:ABC-type transport system substrate-binding protein